MVTRREFLNTSASFVKLAEPPRRPNLLFIVADQWRALTLPSSGDPDLIAPNLERLAKQGIHFSRAYTSNPVCTPSRAAMLTGKFPHACRMPFNNLQLPLDERCIADEFKKAGYATGYVGKWHLDGESKPGFVPPERRRGFDYWAAFNRGHNYFKSTYYRDTAEPINMTGFEPDYQTGLAIDFIGANKAKPWYLFLSWGPPHTPRTPPPRHAKTYDPVKFHLHENVPASYAEKARQGHAGYYGLCTALDENIGRLLKALDEYGLTEDTIVVFTSDHGDMLGAQGLEYKGVPYEESTNIPLLMRYPRKLEGGRSDDVLISNVDYMPTLLALCGINVPESVQGQNLAEYILTGKGKRPESVYVEGKMGTPDEWRMIVRGYDKLVVSTQLQVTHLYNLAQDPYEMTNGATAGAEERRRNELKALLRRWILSTGDRLPYPMKQQGGDEA